MVIFQEAFCIEATESDIIQVHRSPAAHSVVVEGSSPISCQAFVCVIKGDDGYRVYAAIYGREIKRSLIYAVEPPSVAPSGFDDSLKEARRFVEEIGFQLEAVSLKYSAAMREVILREIPVLLPPDGARQILQERAAEKAEAAFLISQAAETGDGGDGDLPTAEPSEKKQNRQTRIAAATSAARRLDIEKRLDEQAAALRRALEPAEAAVNAPETAAAERSEREQLRREKALAEQRAAELEKTIDQLREQMGAGEEKRDKLAQAASEAAQRITRLEKSLQEAENRNESGAARSTVATDLHAAAEARLAEMTEKLELSEREIAAERAECKRLLQSLAEEKNRNAEARKSLKAAEKEIAARTSELAAAEKNTAALEESLQQVRDEAEAEKKERERLARANTADQRRVGELHQALEKAKQSSAEREEKITTDTAVQDRVAELEELLRKAEVRAEAEAAQRKELRQAGKAHERRIAELQQALDSAQASAGAERNDGAGLTADERIIELKEALRREEERSEFLRLEVERFAAAKSMAEKRLSDLEKGLAPPPAVALESGPKSFSGTPFSLLRSESAAPPEVARRPPPPGAFFLVDWDLTKVSVNSINDICEIHQSMSMVQLCLEGYPNQFCSAYIVILHKGAMKEVFIPFRLSGSNRVLVYVPAKQPDNQAALAKTMKEAAKFLKTVGMETERVPLPRHPANLSRELEMVLSFDQPPKNAGNF